MTPVKKSQRGNSLLIKGGHLIDPAQNVDAPMDVLLRDGKVVEIALPNKTRGGADEKFDARGLIVAPATITSQPALSTPLFYGVESADIVLSLGTSDFVNSRSSVQIRASAPAFHA